MKSQVSRATALFLLTGLLPLLTACGESPSADRPPSEGPPTAPAPVPEPSLDALSAPVQEQLRERRAWFQRTLGDPELSQELRAEAYGEIGALYDAYSLNDTAIVAYRNAWRLAPDDFRWPYYLGQVLRAENRPDEAADYLRQAQLRAPDDVPTRVRLGEVLLDLNLPEEAAEHLRRAVELDPSNTPAHFNLGQIALTAGNAAEAVEHFRTVLATDPEATAVHYPLGLALRQLGDTEAAERHLQQRGDGEPKLSDPLQQRLWQLSQGQQRYQAMGEQALSEQNWQAATEAFGQATLLDPLYVRPRLRLVVSLLQLGQPAAAHRQLESILRLDPAQAVAHAQLAFLLVRAGEMEGALTHYQAATSADPENVPYRLSYAHLLRDLGRTQEAFQQYQEVIQRAAVDTPEHADARRNAVVCRLLQGDDAGARQLVQQSLELLPEDHELAHIYARLLATSSDPAVRDPEVALRLASAVMQQAAGPQRAETLAMALAASGRFREAAELQQRLLDATTDVEGAAAVRQRLQANLDRYRQDETALDPWGASSPSPSPTAGADS